MKNIHTFLTNMISSRNSPNILLYGKTTNDMDQIMDSVMKQFIKGDLQTSYHNKITYKLSNIHYEFDMRLFATSSQLLCCL